MTGRPILVAAALALALAGCTPRELPDPIEPPRLPAGFVEAQAGERASELAARVGVPFEQVALINGLEPPYQMRPGQVLRLPDRNGYLVSQGDTVSEIAVRYDTTTGILAALNDLTQPYTIYPGNTLIVPVAMQVTVAGEPLVPPVAGPAVVAAPAGEVTVEPLGPSVEAADPLALDPGGGLPVEGAPQPLVPLNSDPDAAGPTVAAGPAPPPVTAGPAPVATGGRFAWPVVGNFVSGYGPKPDGTHNDGVNIAAPRGTAVLAADAGTVAYAGNELRGFGNLVLVRHAGDWVTAYAHLDRILVAQDEQIRLGQPVGTVGDSGTVGEPQLHFEIRRGTEAIDPTSVLPPFPE